MSTNSVYLLIDKNFKMYKFHCVKKLAVINNVNAVKQILLHSLTATVRLGDISVDGVSLNM